MIVQYKINVNTRLKSFIDTNEPEYTIKDLIAESIFKIEFKDLNSKLNQNQLFDLYKLGKKFFFPNTEGNITLDLIEINTLKERLTKTHPLLGIGLAFEILDAPILAHENNDLD